MTQLPYETPAIPLDFRNQKSGLMVFGIILIVLGALAGCLALTTPLVFVVMRQMPTSARAAIPEQQMDLPTIVTTVLFYGVLSGGLIWSGIGAIRAHRWVRPIVLAVTSIILVIGVFALVVVACSLPAVTSAIQAARPSGGTAPPAGMAIIGIVIGLGVAGLFYVVIPLVLHLYFRRTDVKRTLEFYDAKDRWTDHCPQPVLTLCLALVLFAGSTLLAVPHPVVPLFGAAVGGNVAVIILIVNSVLVGMSARLIYRQQMIGWWISIGLLTLFAISGAVTVLKRGPMVLYETMDLPPQQMEVLRAAQGPSQWLSIAVTFMAFAVFLAFAIYVRQVMKRNAVAM